MSNWPQYLTIGWYVFRFIVLIAKDMDEPTASKMWIGVCGTSLAVAFPLWILYVGGFFDGL